MTELAVQFQTKVEATAQDLRHAYERPLGEGVEGHADFQVSPGAAVTTVNVSAGIGFVRGDGLADLGLYRIRNDATKNSAAFESGGIPAPHATKPRLDQVIARIYDDDADGEGQRKWRLTILTGTATTGATLDNRSGAAAVPNSAMLIADVLVAPGAPAVIPAEAIRDRRVFCYPVIPPLLTDIDLVSLIPVAPSLGLSTVAGPLSSNGQIAYAAYLPRRIVGATRIRWACTSAIGGGTVNLGLYDASGREIVTTGAVAAAEGRQSTPIAATTFEAGVYYVFSGLGASGVANQLGSKLGAVAPNTALILEGGGTTAPKTLLGFANQAPGAGLAPEIALSVG